MEDVFTARDVSKHYGRHAALRGLSMHIERGAIYGLVGQNGAGKTTLMRLLCGLQKASGGTMSMQSARPVRIAAIVEKPALYDQMTAEENMIAQYRFLGLRTRAGIAQKLQMVGLADTGRKTAKDFSLGMRQKLGIAMALAGDPEFLALDEPLNGLDPQGIIEVRALIQNLNRERNVTFLISSHILSELTKLATHYGFIHQGRMIREMTAGELESDLGKAFCAQVSDTAKLKAVCDSLNIRCEILSPVKARLYSDLSVSRLALALNREQCELISCWRDDESLEEYFVKMVGGMRDA